MYNAIIKLKFPSKSRDAFPKTKVFGKLCLFPFLLLAIFIAACSGKDTREAKSETAGAGQEYAKLA
jgi:hypothetical protein